MSEATIAIGGVLGVIVLGTGIAFYAHAVSVADKATLGRAEQRVETQNYEESVAFREGTRRDFETLVLSYHQAKSPDEKEAVLSLMRHRAQGCPPDLVPQTAKDLLATADQKRVNP